MSMKTQDQSFKIIICGDSNTGKTSLIYNQVKSKCAKNLNSTVGVEQSSKLVEVGHQFIQLQLWDTAGQERYRSITKTYFRGSVGALIIFDLTKYSSFENVKSWYTNVKSLSLPETSIMIVGNKADLDSHRVVTREEALALADSQGLMQVETSAFTGLNVPDTFQKLAEVIQNKIDTGVLDPFLQQKNNLYNQITKEQGLEREKNGGCSC